MASESTPERNSVLVFDWNDKSISTTRLDTIRKNASYLVFPIPRPSYILETYELRIDLRSYTGFEELYVINTPPGFSDLGHRSYAPSSYHFLETPPLTTSSAQPQESASNIPLTSGWGSSGARLGASIPSHDVHRSNTQSTSNSSESTPNILQTISEDIIRVYPSSTDWYRAAFTVRWELDQYLETELDFDPDAQPVKNLFEPVLTITGTSSAAYATTAKSYIQRVWPGGRVLLLRHLRRWAGNKGSGKSLLLNRRTSTFV